MYCFIWNMNILIFEFKARYQLCTRLGSHVKNTILTESVRSSNWKYLVISRNVYDPLILKQHDHFAELKRSSSHSKMMYGNDHPQMKVYDQKSLRLFGSEWWVFADDRIFSINDLVLSFEDGRFRTRIISERISSVMIAYFKPGSNSVRIVYLSKIVYLTWSYA